MERAFVFIFYACLLFNCAFCLPADSQICVSVQKRHDFSEMLEQRLL